MTRTQWKRFQRKKKAEFEATESSNKAKIPPPTYAQVVKKPLKERIFPPIPLVTKSKDKKPVSTEDDDILIDNCDSGFDDELDIICNVVSVLPIEFDKVSEVTEDEESCVVK